MAFPVDDGAVVIYSSNTAWILANFAHNFTQTAVHKELSTLNTAQGPDPDQLHLFMFKILDEYLPWPVKVLLSKSIESAIIP